MAGGRPEWLHRTEEQNTGPGRATVAWSVEQSNLYDRLADPCSVNRGDCDGAGPPAAGSAAAALALGAEACRGGLRMVGEALIFSVTGWFMYRAVG